MSSKTFQLFGGSIVAELPSRFTDVRSVFSSARPVNIAVLTGICSNIRQVPDHQEVYLDSEGFTSIVVEILERVDKPDPDALKYHLEDMVEGDAEKTRIISTAEAHFAKLPYVLARRTRPQRRMLTTTSQDWHSGIHPGCGDTA